MMQGFLYFAVISVEDYIKNTMFHLYKGNYENERFICANLCLCHGICRFLL